MTKYNILVSNSKHDKNIRNLMKFNFADYPNKESKKWAAIKCDHTPSPEEMLSILKELANNYNCGRSYLSYDLRTRYFLSVDIDYDRDEREVEYIKNRLKEDYNLEFTYDTINQSTHYQLGILLDKPFDFKLLNEEAEWGKLRKGFTGVINSYFEEYGTQTRCDIHYGGAIGRNFYHPAQISIINENAIIKKEDALEWFMPVSIARYEVEKEIATDVAPEFIENLSCGRLFEGWNAERKAKFIKMSESSRNVAGKYAITCEFNYIKKNTGKDIDYLKKNEFTYKGVTYKDLFQAFVALMHQYEEASIQYNKKGKTRPENFSKIATTVRGCIKYIEENHIDLYDKPEYMRTDLSTASLRLSKACSICSMIDSIGKDNIKQILKGNQSIDKYINNSLLEKIGRGKSTIYNYIRELKNNKLHIANLFADYFTAYDQIQRCSPSVRARYDEAANYARHQSFGEAISKILQSRSKTLKIDIYDPINNCKYNKGRVIKSSYKTNDTYNPDFIYTQDLLKSNPRAKNTQCINIITTAYNLTYRGNRKRETADLSFGKLKDITQKILEDLKYLKFYSKAIVSKDYLKYLDCKNIEEYETRYNIQVA